MWGQGKKVWLFPSTFPCSPQLWALTDLLALFSGTFAAWLGKDYDLNSQLLVRSARLSQVLAD